MMDYDQNVLAEPNPVTTAQGWDFLKYRSLVRLVPSFEVESIIEHDRVRFAPRGDSAQSRREFAGENCWTRLNRRNSMEKWQRRDLSVGKIPWQT